MLLQHKLRPPFPLTIPSPPEYLQLNRAILFGVLSEPHLAKIHIKYLNAIVTDGYGFFVNLLIKIVVELYPKLVESVRIQLLWVTSKMVDVSAVGVDNLLVFLLRQIVGGDFSDGNLWLSLELLKVFLANWDWLLEEPLILTSALFAYLRLLADHYRLSGSPTLEALKRMEIDFCIRVLREHLHLCLRIGRDLIRLLQDLMHIPEFLAVWKDLLLNPVEFRTPVFSDISQLYCLRTSSRYFLLRITPEMETQLQFLLTHVRWGSQKRYQAWFARKFLCGPERETIICDLVRFICCAHHPTNEIIQSDVIPRWAVIGWLLKSCRKNHVEANVKLALFYDWLFFDERVDNIMNIEPGILLMVNSIPKYIDITHTLLEFLFLLVDNYDVERKDVIISGVSAAFSILVKKGVVHSLDALTSCSALSPFLKERILNTFAGLKSRVSKGKTALVPCFSLTPLSFPSPSNVENLTLLPREIRRPTRAGENGSGTKSVDSSVPVSDGPITSCSPVAITDKSQCHVDGYVYFMSGRREESVDFIVNTASKMDKKLVAKLVVGAFAAYRCLLMLSSNSLRKEADASSAKLLFSDIEIGLKRFCTFWKDTVLISHSVKSSVNLGFVVIEDCSLEETILDQLQDVIRKQYNWTTPHTEICPKDLGTSPNRRWVVWMSRAMELNQILRENEIHFAIPAALPVFFLSYLALVSACMI
ncbi:hypothetical protein HHK36_017117 [Tetracentron sinense]|uniref:Integrator complex subunit 3 N-terminal domain-containing protein n=1 Tax=Tetracentron sinense TaxID=13715 RepID=A0A835DCI6_TETSI|nr:hypothetical protein HHK36_017117 [Tetracentron sinense]